ncbi:MAG: DEAD/DEAH box helicase, partial [Acidimicrobiia bacterium]|nr:DEAD/DEAH box helicase [Acidimicrobiia bacterium]
MNVFKLRDELIKDYARYIGSFLAIKDQRIKDRVDLSLQEGRLWPEPMIGLNPAFEKGEFIEELTTDKTLHRDCGRIFRVGKSEERPLGEAMRLHRHQVEAIRAATAGRNFVLTTGTGSGKSLAYIVPIVDHVLRNGSGKGVQAIVVYPMNALANSQERELEKFLSVGTGGTPPVAFRRYTGQENDEQKREILANPPDIILTNYVMLELILTRVKDRKLVEAAEGLKFLVLDELHTYRGRQGADVALLARRVREACKARSLQCIGTSATLASGGNYETQQQEVARVASLLFGDEVAPRDVIGETLRRATPQCDSGDPAFVAELRSRLASNDPPPTDYDMFCNDPLSRWIEATFGVEEREGRLARVVPRSISGPTGAAKDLESLTGIDRSRCESAIASQLLTGYDVKVPGTPFPAFAFRLHQFISKGDTVYASFEAEEDRYLTLHYQRFKPG